ncbi:MAG TPA: DNA-processing protein DprA [Syntrophales bacterium]|nr:DNA-processing protein DprA [Syntrophales bacterium]
MDIKTIQRSDSCYPASLETYLGRQAPESIFAHGNLHILQESMLALFCSVKCPGNLIIQTYDLVRHLRDTGATVISGFHSPMEKECLALLLRGKQPVIWCRAKRLMAGDMPKVYVESLAAGRLLILSPFGEVIKRPTQESASIRNECAAALADRVFVAYAAPGGKTEAFCRKVLTWGKSLSTFDSPENTRLLATGAQPYKGSLVKLNSP